MTMFTARLCTGLTTLVLAGASTLAGAQTPEVKLPPSPRGEAQIELGGKWETVDGNARYTGGKWITVDYGRPILRGRKDIFGSGPKYGEFVRGGALLWRAGANATTRLTTQATLVVGDKTLEPGVYNVLVDLKEGAWTLVFTNQPVQEGFDPNDKERLSGAVNYDPKFDLARVPMTLTNLPLRVEQFTIGFVDASDNSVMLGMWWDNVQATAALRFR
jgi:hypothetical protein